MQLLELYKKAPYEPLVPKSSNPEQDVFKFNSPQHFVSYVQELNEKFQRGTGYDSSESGSSSFTLSEDMADAYNVIRETKFNPNENSLLESKISEIKKGTIYSDTGYEIDIPEYLSGSERVWIDSKSKKTPTRIIDDVLMIDVAYSSMRDAETSKQIGMAILESIYRHKVIPRNLSAVFATKNLKSGGGSSRYLTTIDVPFNDLNGIAKMLHPSSFRRLWFRLVEQYPGLTSGYGNCRDGSSAYTQKGYISIDKLHSIWSNKEQFEKEIEVFLGIESKK